MKKQKMLLGFIVSLCIIMLGIAGCNKAKETIKIECKTADNKESNAINEEIIMTVEPNVVTKDTLHTVTVTIKNHLQTEIRAVNDFRMEKKTDNGWEEVEMNMAFYDCLYQILPEEEKSIVYDLSEQIPLEQPAHYRIIKNVYDGELDYEIISQFQYIVEE